MNDATHDCECRDEYVDQSRAAQDNMRQLNPDFSTSLVVFFVVCVHRAKTLSDSATAGVP